MQYEQGVWVEGECVLEGLFGPAIDDIEEQNPEPPRAAESRGSSRREGESEESGEDSEEEDIY